jgi:hypothetical protein
MSCFFFGRLVGSVLISCDGYMVTLDNCNLKGLDDTELIGMYVPILIQNFTYLEAVGHCLYWIIEI